MALGLVVFLSGLLVTTPNFEKIIRPVRKMGGKEAQAPLPELGKYLSRATTLGVSNVVLLLVALAFMVVAGFY